MIPRCRTDQFSRSFLPSVVRLRILLPSSVFNGGTLSFYKSTMNLRLLRAWLDYFASLFQSFFAVLLHAWYHGSGVVLVCRCTPTLSSMCRVFIILTIIIIGFLLPFSWPLFLYFGTVCKNMISLFAFFFK